MTSHSNIVNVKEISTLWEQFQQNNKDLEHLKYFKMGEWNGEVVFYVPIKILSLILMQSNLGLWWKLECLKKTTDLWQGN